jgi:hypothetical protein
MLLKSQDVVLVLSVVAWGNTEWSYASLAEHLGLSVSQVHSSVRRIIQLGLMDAQRKPNRRALLEFLVHGLKYVIACERNGITRGLPTAHAASPLKKLIASGETTPPVWPDPDGIVRGEALLPLHRCAVTVAKKDAQVYEFLALTDAIRSGRARERKLAEQELRKRLTK